MARPRTPSPTVVQKTEQIMESMIASALAYCAAHPKDPNPQAWALLSSAIQQGRLFQVSTRDSLDYLAELHAKGGA